MKLFLLLLATGLGALAQVPEVSVEGSKRSFILSVAMLNQSQVDIPGSINQSDLDQSKVGLGFSAEYNLHQSLGLELGIFNVKRQYLTESGQGELVQEVRRAHLPLLLRGWLLNYVSAGFGPYVGVRTDDVRSAESGNVDGLGTPAGKDFEWGVEGSLTLNIAYGDKTGLYFEGRWSEPFDRKADVETNRAMAIGGVKVEVDL